MNYVENFPWLKSVFQAFCRTFPGKYSNESLKLLHVNLQKELQNAIKNKDQDCLQKLFSCLQCLYSHFCWKINGLKNYESCMKISCVIILSSLIQIGIILSKKNSAFSSINTILAALKIFPGTFEMLCDAILLLNSLKKQHYEDFCLILKQLLFTTKFDAKEPSSYFKALLLLRRLKFLSKDSFEKSKVISLANKMEVPPGCMSWLLENGIESASILSDKSIVKQFFNRKLPPTFFSQLRQVLQHELYFDHFLQVDSRRDITVFEESHIFKIDPEIDNSLIENSSNANEVIYFNKDKISSLENEILIKKNLLQNESFSKKSSPIPMKEAEFVFNYTENSSFNGFNKKDKCGIYMINKKSEIIHAPNICVKNAITDDILKPKTEITEESTHQISSNFEQEKLTNSSSNSPIVTKVSCLTSYDNCLESPIVNEKDQRLKTCKLYENGKHICATSIHSKNTETAPKNEIIQKMNSDDSSCILEKEALDSYIGKVLSKLVDKVANRIDNTKNNPFETLKDNILKNVTPLKYPSKASVNKSVSCFTSLQKEDNPVLLDKITKCLSFSDVSLNSVKEEKKENIVSVSLFNKVAGKFNCYRETLIDDTSDSVSNFVVNDNETNDCSKSDSDGESNSELTILSTEELKQDIVCDKSSKELVCVETSGNSSAGSPSFLMKCTNFCEQSFGMKEAKIFADLQPRLLVNLGRKCNIDKDFPYESSFKTESCVKDSKIVLHNIKQSKEVIEKDEENNRTPEGLFYQLNANLNISSNKVMTDSNINPDFSESNVASPHKPHAKEPTLVATKVSKYVDLIESQIQPKNVSIELKPSRPFDSTKTVAKEKVQSQINLRKRCSTRIAENRNMGNIAFSKKRSVSKALESHDFNLNVNFDLGTLTLDAPPKKKPCKTISSLQNKKEEKDHALLSYEDIDEKNKESKYVKSYNLRSSSRLIKPSRLTILK